jgi:hypothetical protein
MINNYERKVIEMQDQIKILSQLIIGDWQNCEIHDVEEKIFRALLKVGKNALEAYTEKKGTGEEAFGDGISSYSEKKWDYISIFGTIKINRAYFWKPDNGGGIFPLDKDLNLPQKHHSYLLQDWNQILAVDSNFDHAREILEKILGINIWSRQSEEINRSATESVEQFYKDNPQPQLKQPILVAEADGKGIVIRKDNQDKEEKIKVRLKKGEKNGKKKMATVTAVFGIERNIRDVDDIIKYEIGNSTNNPEKKPEIKIATEDGPKLENKTVRATLEGKAKAFERIVEEVESRDPEDKCERIILMDGERALEKKVNEYLLPLGFIIILDLFHVMERLWKLCYFFCKEASIASVQWVRKYLTMILTGKTGYFIGAIRQKIKKGKYTKSKKTKIEKILRYFEKRKEYMKYDEYLAKGYPIGSGVIEGTCRSFVKDRMELAGMRWSEIGAEAMLELRSVKVNGKWNDFWTYFINKEKERKYSHYNSYYDSGNIDNKNVA